MRIKMKQLSCGPEGNKYPGLEYEVSQKQGREMIEAGAADAVGVPAAARGSRATDPGVTAASKAAASNPDHPANRQAAVVPPKDQKPAQTAGSGEASTSSGSASVSTPNSARAGGAKDKKDKRKGKGGKG